MQVFKNKPILQILDKYKDLWAIGHVSAVSHWDLETYMPQKGAGARGQALGRLATIRQRLFLDPAFTKLLVSAGKQKLNDQEKAVVRTLVRALKFYEKLPSKFIKVFEILYIIDTFVWSLVKENNNFINFEKYLAQKYDMINQAYQ